MGSYKDKIILVRGAGDIATGIIWVLAYAGFKVVCTDISNPSCIRRTVSFSEAIYDKKKEINGVCCDYVRDVEDIDGVLSNGHVALIIDENLSIINKRKFDVVIDAILAKKNLGTNISMAPLVIGVGPGFTANVDCHYAIETMRGHNLAKIYEEGSPIANTGVPGLIAGHSSDRVMHSPCEGVFHLMHNIGDVVKKDEVLAVIDESIDHKATGNKVLLKATIDGVLRGILRDGFYAKNNLKCADIDPRISEIDNCFTISDKARAVGMSVLTAIMHKFQDYY